MKLRNLFNSKKVKVGKSKICGLGLVAKKDIKKGEIVFLLRGVKRKIIIKKRKDSLTGPNWIGVDHFLWIDSKGPPNYINHSCNPNIGINGRVTFVALRNIKKGEELFFDYSATEDDLLWEMKCLCGYKKCRGVLRSIQFLPLPVFKKYLPFIPHYFQKVYCKYHNIKNNG